jgi:hypothetical protein
MGQDRQDRARQFGSQVYGFGQGNFQNAMATYGQQFLGQSAAYSPAMLYNSAYGMSQGLGSKIFQPESQYNANIVTANQSNELQARMATASNKAALTGSIIGGVTSMATAGMSGMAKTGTGFFSKPPTPDKGSWITNPYGQ